MNNQTGEPETLEEIAQDSIIPMKIDDNGDLVEVIICDGICGKSRYQNEMPISLHLTRVLKDGTEYSCQYSQIGRVEKRTAQTTGS